LFSYFSTCNFSPRSLFEGLENISEDEQLARVLALSVEEAAGTAALHLDNAAVAHVHNAAVANSTSRHSPIPGIVSPVSVVDIGTPPPPPPAKRSQTQSLQEQFDLWKRIPVSERESLVLDEDFDPDKLADVSHVDNPPESNFEENEPKFYTGKL
jgi:hypothetical protein